MIQGTGSGAGKSLVAAAFCRIFRDEGMNVAPFKAQNMALNSFITREGGEIGRAQALQARAAGLVPRNDMNPVLLKVSGESGSQVIVQGKVRATMKAREYYAFRDEAWKAVTESYRRLAAEHELIIMEGAGSPAEINLLDVDIVNMAMAKFAKAPVLLVGDIDRGGVFASLYGTIKLLGRDAGSIKGFLINKFRGDRSILDPGLAMIAERTGRPVVGVLPYVQDLGLPEEDGLALAGKTGVRTQRSEQETVKIVVVRLKYISNFTDFDPLEAEPDVDVLYSDAAADIESADIVILPGSKNTVEDLLLLREKGLDGAIARACGRDRQVIGICGGYQMLGRNIRDPLGSESGHASVDCIGLLNIETLFRKEKETCLVQAQINDSAAWGHCGTLKGYEIHLGESTGDIGLFSVTRDRGSGGAGGETVPDGSRNGRCWGTYIHGIFENDRFRRSVINEARRTKGLPPQESAVEYDALLERSLDRLAMIVREHVDMDFVRRMIA